MRQLTQEVRQLDEILSNSKIHFVLSAKQNCHTEKEQQEEVISMDPRLQIRSEFLKISSQQILHFGGVIIFNNPISKLDYKVHSIL